MSEINRVDDSGQFVYQIVRYMCSAWRYCDMVCNTSGYVEGLKGKSWSHLKTIHLHKSSISSGCVCSNPVIQNFSLSEVRSFLILKMTKTLLKTQN